MCVCGFFVLNFRIEILHMSFFSVSCVKQRMRERDFSIVHSYTNTFEHFCFKHSINCCVYSLSIDSFLLTFKWQMKCFGSLTEYTSFVIITIRLGQRHPLIDSNLLSFFSLCSQLEFARRHAKSEKKIPERSFSLLIQIFEISLKCIASHGCEEEEERNWMWTVSQFRFRVVLLIHSI